MQTGESRFPTVMNFQNHRWSLLNAVICYICLIMMICFINKRCSLSINNFSNSTDTESLQNLDRISLKLENNGEIIVLINETTNDLYLIKLILRTGKILYYDLFDAFEFSKAFKQCGSGEKCENRHKTRRNISHCPYYFHVHLVQFCYDIYGQVSSVILHNEVVLTKNDVIRFNHILKLFLKV